MTDGWSAIVCSRQLGCRSVRARLTPPADWEAQRHAHEVRYWAGHLDEFVSFLPGIRRRRGDERGVGLVGDVLTVIRGEEGEDPAVIARDRLMDAWRGEKPRWGL